MKHFLYFLKKKTLRFTGIRNISKRNLWINFQESTNCKELHFKESQYFSFFFSSGRKIWKYDLTLTLTALFIHYSFHSFVYILFLIQMIHSYVQILQKSLPNNGKIVIPTFLCLKWSFLII